MRSGLEPSADFAGLLSQNSKLAKAVPPVFFRQCPACVVTRNGFQTVCELNPQAGRQLKVIASMSTSAGEKGHGSQKNPSKRPLCPKKAESGLEK
jgi:hypothetical protein